MLRAHRDRGPHRWGAPPTPPDVRITYPASRLVRSGKCPEALPKPGVPVPDARSSCDPTDQGSEVQVRTGLYHLAALSDPPTFQAFDGPAHGGIFPTDFSSTMPSADCPSAISFPCGPLTASCDALFVFPFPRAHGAPRRRRTMPRPWSAGWPPLRLLTHRAWGSPGVLPTAFDA